MAFDTASKYHLQKKKVQNYNIILDCANKKCRKPKSPALPFTFLFSHFELLHSHTLGVEGLAVAEDEELAVLEEFLGYG